ncbi:restriction endonuclease subunit S [Pseudomonas sp. MWU318]|uniref:restriction endonuclease subunit S n=1 Tax=Pseudomonas sp. MWU318 TaxID=2802569 RepID=UPI001927E2FF|nr:restriction endonuclease subunit S [Pseudomonas sp. MWU318]
MKPTDALPHPAEWKTTTVGDAVELKRGISWSKEQEHLAPTAGAVPVIRIGNVQDRLELDDLVYISGLKTKSIEMKRVAVDWSIMVGSNGNRQRIGNAARVVVDADFLFASFLMAAKPKPDSGVTPEYFYRWLRSEQVQAYLSASAEGSTGLSNLSQSFFRAMTIPYPGPEEQRAIARVLDTVDTAIERARVALVNAKALDHSLLHELLERGAGNVQGVKRPAHWQLKRVDEVADVRAGVTLGKDVTGFNHIELPYLRVANVQDGYLNLNTIKTVKVRLEEVERYRLEPGDVLMTEGGDLDKLGRGTLWDGQIPNCLHQNHIFSVRANRALLDPRYFACIIESDIAKSYFTRVAKRTTNLASTNKTQVRAFRFPLPPTLEEQEQIAEIMKASKAKLRTIEQKEKILRQLKASLTHDLLTGAMRVDPDLIKEE